MWAIYFFIDLRLSHISKMVKHSVCLQAEFNRTKLIILFSRLIRLLSLSQSPYSWENQIIDWNTSSSPTLGGNLNLPSLLAYCWPLLSLNNETVGAGYNNSVMSMLVLSSRTFLTDHLQMWCFNIRGFCLKWSRSFVKLKSCWSRIVFTRAAVYVSKTYFYRTALFSLLKLLTRYRWSPFPLSLHRYVICFNIPSLTCGVCKPLSSPFAYYKLIDLFITTLSHLKNMASLLVAFHFLFAEPGLVLLLQCGHRYILLIKKPAGLWPHRENRGTSQPSAETKQHTWPISTPSRYLWPLRSLTPSWTRPSQSLLMLHFIGWNVMRQICGRNVFQLISLQEWGARDSHADTDFI